MRVSKRVLFKAVVLAQQQNNYNEVRKNIYIYIYTQDRKNRTLHYKTLTVHQHSKHDAIWATTEDNIYWEG